MILIIVMLVMIVMVMIITMLMILDSSANKLICKLFDKLVFFTIYNSPFAPSWNGFDFKPMSHSNYHLLKPIIKPIILYYIIKMKLKIRMKFRLKLEMKMKL